MAAECLPSKNWESGFSPHPLALINQVTAPSSSTRAIMPRLFNRMSDLVCPSAIVNATKVYIDLGQIAQHLRVIEEGILSLSLKSQPTILSFQFAHQTRQMRPYVTWI